MLKPRSVVEADILEMLLSHEQILFVTKQSRIRPGGSIVTPNSIYVSNRRLIWRNPRLLGLKKDYNTAEYKDISNIRLKKGIFSTEIFLNNRWLSDPIKLPAMNKQDAAKVGAYIQQGMRQELPGQITTEKATSPQIIKRPEEQDPIAQLEKLGKLRDAGVLTEEEFDTKKKDILSNI